MDNAAPSTLIMLLSTAKLQRGQMSGGFDKRWQTPEDVVAQTKEAINHMRASGRPVAKVVFLYTDTLYLNSAEPGVKIIEKVQDQTLIHRRKLQELLAEQAFGIPTTEMLWSELVQGQSDYQSPRSKLVAAYQTNNDFRIAVQNDNPKRKGEIDPIPEGSKKGSAPSEADLFVLEEIGLFDGLAKGHISSNKVDLNGDIVLAYPGPLMQSLQVLQDTKLKIHKGHPSRRHQTVHASWLDVTDPSAAKESIFHTAEAHPDAVKKHQAEARKVRAHRLRRLTTMAAGIMAVVATTISGFIFNRTSPITSDNLPSIAENDYQAAVSYANNSGEKTTVTFRKSSKDQPADLWTASQVQVGEKDVGRALIFREDVAHIQNAQNALALLGKISKQRKL